MAHFRLAFLMAALLCGGAAADEVRLANGDRISGELKGKSGDKLVVTTEHAGELAIDWARVVSISTTRAVAVMLEGESAPARGTLLPLYGGGALLVDAGGKAREIRLAEIAYLNPEPHQVAGGVDYSGRATLAANYTSGNVESERLYAEGAFNARAREYRYALTGRTERREDVVLGTVASWLAGANYDRFLRERRFAYARASLEHDELKGIDRRAAVGGGYGWQLFDTERIALSVRAGLDYVTVQRIGAADDRYPALGWGVELNAAPWESRLELFHEQEGFWNLEDSDVLTLRTKSGVRIPLVARLNATAQVNVDWERSPVPPRESTDTVVLLGVDYTW